MKMVTIQRTFWNNCSTYLVVPENWGQKMTILFDLWILWHSNEIKKK